MTELSPTARLIAEKGHEGARTELYEDEDEVTSPFDDDSGDGGGGYDDRCGNPHNMDGPPTQWPTSPCNALSEHQMAQITSDCVCPPA